ncbi:MAG TPA: hypothetical protein VHU13_02510 [Solirubrobacteraceae bacterium]|jgi:hypothetical protein|nr:hypothetical protein [Solirubrobacteraceae bacterium]
MSEASPLEGLLHRALAPVEPPEDLGRRLESALVDITASAAEELEGWEISAMRDPRNWVRPAAAAVVGGGAGLALVVLRARRSAARERGRLPAARAAVRRTAEDLRRQASRLR